MPDQPIELYNNTKEKTAANTVKKNKTVMIIIPRRQLHFLPENKISFSITVALVYHPAKTGAIDYIFPI